MKVVIPGGSGQVGTILAQAFDKAGYEIVVLSRNPTPFPWRVVAWDAKTLGSWASEIDGAKVVINLAGYNVNCRYHQQNRRLIKNSRVESTRIVGEAIARVSSPPAVWLQASTATIYAHRYDAPNDETNGIIGGSEENAPETWRFSIDVAKSWEQALNEAIVPHTRKILLRSAMIMSPDRGGVFDTILGLTRYGLGGRAGDGKQYVSWIHDQDFIRSIFWIIEHEEIKGHINLSSPNPVTNAEFMRILRESWGIRIGLPATTWMLEIGAILIRTETELILKSRRVIPGMLQAMGFDFHFPTWAEAARDLCKRWRE
jgi:uncharacterized protein